MERKLRADAEAAALAAIDAVLPDKAVERALKGKRFPGRVFPVAVGKAIPSGLLKAGDIIRYKKTNGKQHAMMYYGSGKVCEASHKNRYGAVVKDTKRYNTQSKENTIQVFRAKE